MKKRMLSLLMALCLMLTLVPAAFAVDNQPDTITLPNGEVREIPTLDPITTSYVLARSTDNAVEINNINDLQAVAATDWYSNRTFIIKNDLNLSSLYEGKGEWSGFITYFLGNLVGEKKANGEYPVISGIPNNCCLIYGIIGGTIENLTFQYDGQAAFITMMPVRLNSTTDYSLTLRNVTTEGYVTLTGSDQSNYSPFVYCSSTGGLAMYNCTNNAVISGPIYGSVFHGYYPMVGSSYVFDNCVNEKNVTLNYAGMFFGNSTNLESRLSEISLTIKDCKNNATIRGTQGAKYLSAPIGGSYTDTSEMQKVESLLNPAEISVVGAVMTYHNIEAITGSGCLIPTSESVDFGAELDGEDIKITHSDGVASYSVAVGAYVNMWNVELNKFDGTDRVSVTETIDATNVSNGATLTATLKAYGFADSNFGEEDFNVLTYAVRYGDDEKSYYAVNNNVLYYDSTIRHYVSNVVGDNGPVGEGSKEAQFITVSAYDSTGTLIGFVSLK